MNLKPTKVKRLVGKIVARLIIKMAVGEMAAA
jgi:hypothetical protein